MKIFGLFSYYYVLRKIELVAWFQMERGAGHRTFMKRICWLAAADITPETGERSPKASETTSCLYRLGRSFITFARKATVVAIVGPISSLERGKKGSLI
ncbi:hypothetical protein SADUNF_Sadunf02G0011200 [Salix dunnii]|uniref:Uncharacterized protein n=1 Tax=Salix dunnii TaxID=1413687 RepID=A0A835N5H7_9ROSI|nr:hypothetical protein SADUNF_Sadunf02G0011200 [Salix dunnii]